MRIIKHVAKQKMASRREAERLLKQGKILVNGVVETDYTKEISPQDQKNGQ